MAEKKPRLIICAIRGGQESLSIIKHAINISLEYKPSLTFFSVMDEIIFQDPTA